MKTVVFIHIALIALGGMLGFFAKVVEPISGDHIWVSFAALPATAVLAVLVLGLASFAVGNSRVRSAFWFTYLCAVFGVSLGVGLAGQSIVYGLEWQTPISVIFGGAGYLIGLVGVARVYRWRYKEAL